MKAATASAAVGEQRERARHRRQQRDHDAGQHGSQHLDRDRVAGGRQQRAGQRRFQHLRMHLHARHRRVHRRGLDVEQADRRGPHQHELAGDLLGRDLSFDDVLGRDVSGLVVQAEVDPDAAVLVGRQFEARNRDRANPRVVGADQDRARASDRAEQIERERRHDLVLRSHNHRHPAHDPVPFRADGEQPAARGGLLQAGEIAQDVRERNQIASGIGTDGGKAGLRGILGRARAGRVGAGLPHHHASLPDRVGEDLVVAGQLHEPLAGRIVDLAEMLHRLVRRRAIGLREDHVEGDRRGLQFVEPCEQVRQDGARPGPLPERRDAGLVDIDDHDWANRGAARADPLIEVEASQPQFLQRGRIPDAQADQHGQQGKADAPAGGEMARQT